MYIRTREMLGLADVPSAKPTPKPCRPPFGTGGEYIREDDAAKLLAVLAGPSCYRKYIQPVLESKAASVLPKSFLRIVSSLSEVPEHLRGRFVKVGDKIVGGTIDRRTGTIYMLPAPGRRIDTRLEFGLHEAVHLFAHPFLALVDEKTFRRNYGVDRFPFVDVGTFQRKYGVGFGEGATQVIVEQIMEAQGIGKYYHERPYDEFTPPVFELMRIFSLDTFARAYFWGQLNEFTEAMEFRWGKDAWVKVAYLTDTKKTKEALAEINRLENAFKKRFEDILRSSPKGDFPTPSRFRSYV
jgi:hypothetical protein